MLLTVSTRYFSLTLWACMQMFVELDVNGDGKISKEEVRACVIAIALVSPIVCQFINGFDAYQEFVEDDLPVSCVMATPPEKTVTLPW